MTPSPPNAPGTHAARRLVIIDGHAQAFRAFYAMAPSAAADGLPNNALQGFASVLARIARGQAGPEGAPDDGPPDLVAVVFDAATEVRTTFRTEIFPAYKAHRNPRPEPLTRQLPHLPALTEAFGIQHFHHPRFEADDLIATIVSAAEQAGLETVIHSADKDLMQLVSPRTSVLDTMRGRRYTPELVRERFGVDPCHIADWLALVGDSSDNVPGVPGLGPKAATRVIRDGGGLLDAIAHPERLSRPHAVKLLAHREQALLSFELTRLRADAPLRDGAFSLDDLVVTPRPRGEVAATLKRFGLPLYLMPPAETASSRPAVKHFVSSARPETERSEQIVSTPPDRLATEGAPWADEHVFFGDFDGEDLSAPPEDIVFGSDDALVAPPETPPAAEPAPAIAKAPITEIPQPTPARPPLATPIQGRLWDD